MPKEEPPLLICLSIHGHQATARREEDDIFAGQFGPLEVSALLWGVTDDVLQFHDWVHVQFGIYLPRLTDIHSCLVRPAGNVAVGAWHANCTHALSFEPLCTQTPSLIGEAKYLVGREQVVTAMPILGHQESLHFSLHSIILGLFVDFFDLITSTRSRQPLMRQQGINLLLHSHLLFF